MNRFHDDEARDRLDVDPHGNHSFGYRFPVDMEAFAKLEAHDEVAKDALANRSLSAMHCSGDAHVRVPRRCSRNVFAQLDMTKRGVDQDFRAVAFLVGVVEELGNYDSVLIRYVASGERNAVDRKLTRLNFGIEDIVSPDYVGVDIRQQRVGNFLLLRELGKNLLVVIGDGVEPNTRRFELRVGVAQLAELRPAGGSPDCGSEKNDYGLLACTIFMEANVAAVLVG